MSSPYPDERDHSGQKPNQAEINAQKDAALKRILEQKARMRLSNIRMVKPELAGMVEDYLIGMASQGRLQSQVTDDQLKQILISLQQPKRDFKISRR
jgi:programmed cell death protein 5